MRVLLIGESWATIGLHLKGFGIYTTGNYEEGGQPLIEALQQTGHDVTYLRNHEVTQKFPDEPAALEAYDVVILSDVGADTFLLHPQTLLHSRIRPNRLQLIADAVKRGGSLLMVGGYLSFSGFEGKANYINNVIAQVLPVEMLGRDDRIELPEGVVPEVVLDHAVLEGISNDWPHFLGYNRLAPKPDAAVLMKVGEDPFLVLGSYGKGKTAAFASDCSPHWGPPGFTGWTDYPQFWDRLVSWLGSKD